MSTNIFSKKIKELTDEEVRFTDDFFRHSIEPETKTDTSLFQQRPEPPTAMDHLKRSARSGAAQSLSGNFTHQDIDEEWLDNEQIAYDGQLAVDVFQTAEAIVITSTVAGVRSEDLELDINGDMITIRGFRRSNETENIQADDYYIQECYWGGFSRSIILPVDIVHNQIDATLNHGILTIRLPKAQHSRNATISVVDVTR